MNWRDMDEIRVSCVKGAVCVPVVIVIQMCLWFAFCPSLEGGQSAIEQQLHRIDWQPTWVVPGARYVGTGACGECHAEIVAAQQSTAMAHALSAPAHSPVLQTRPRLTFTEGPYRYIIERKGDAVEYSVTDGRQTVQVPVSWAFGQGVGHVGQTYVIAYKGSWYEARATFFEGLGALDVTFGHSPDVPRSLIDALGRMVKPAEIRACFGCHSTGGVSEGRLQIDNLTPGISCEGCHGPGGQHVAAMKAGKLQKSRIFNPGTLKPADLVRFCGACHRTREHVQSLHLRGVATVRFQPYRLTLSRCFNPSDARISCIACHDPHRNPERETAFYDSKCAACHSNTKAVRLSKSAAPACPISSSRCINCHMPSYAPPGAHFKFTDHRIRVVRLGDKLD